MKVLITNDDGITSPALPALIRQFRDIATELTIVAPRHEMSAVSHALTIRSALRCDKMLLEGDQHFAVTGTPADCIKLALDRLLPNQPDIVISGINMGANTGANIFYSGTVAGAIEASLNGIRSIAVSVDSFKPVDFTYSADVARTIAQWLCKSSLPTDIVLNVNIPDCSAEDIKGFKITHQSRDRFNDKYDKTVNSDGQIEYWLKGDKRESEMNLESDVFALKERWISVSPLLADFNHSQVYDCRRMLFPDLEAINPQITITPVR